MPETRYFGKTENKYDIVTKVYVDETLQNFYEFKTYTQQFSQTSGTNSFDKIMTIEEGYKPFGFFTVRTEGGVGYGYQSYNDLEMISPTQVRLRGWWNSNGAAQIGFYLPCYRQKLALNTLAYTTKDTLWTGDFTIDNTCNLLHPWKDYDYLDFKLVDGGSRLWKRVYVSNLIEALTNKSQQLYPMSWNSTDRRLIIFTSGTTDTALKVNINGNLYLQEIIGYRVIPEKDLGGSVVIKQIVTGKCDDSGYFKTSSGMPWDIPAGKVLLSARPCTLEEGQSSTFWNAVLNYGSKIIPLYNPNSNNNNWWSILMRGWDDTNNYANMTNIKVELAYA